MEYGVHFKKSWILFLAFAGVLLANIVLCAASAEGLKMEEQEYKQDLNRIESLGRSKNLNGLEKFADEIGARCGRINKECYAHLMLNIVQTLSSEDFEEDRQYILAQKYATLGLEKSDLNRPDQFPLDVELKLLLHIQEDIEYSKGVINGSDWSKLRSQRAKLWFRGWHRLEKEISKDFDLTDLPELNVPQPIGVDLPAGVAPEYIKDSKLRAEYEAAIEKNRQKAEKYNKQYKLRSLEKLFSPKAKKYIVRAYLRPPFNLAELKQYMDTYIADETTKARILDAVTQSMPKE